MMVEEVIRYGGDIQNLYMICGDSLLFGFVQCPKCKAKGAGKFCGRHFVYKTVRSTELPYTEVIETDTDDVSPGNGIGPIDA